MSEARAQRQAVLEEKRRRLAELRESRNRRAEGTARVQSSTATSVEDIVNDILAQPSPVAVPAEEKVEEQQQQEEVKEEKAAPVAAVAAAPAALPTVIVNEAPKAETFTIGTQTDAEEPTERQEEEEAEVPPEATETPKESNGETTTEPTEPKLVSETELADEVQQGPFSDFLQNASKKVERILGNPLTYQDPLDETLMESKTSGPQLVVNTQVRDCPRWTEGREILSLDWSRRDMVLSSYGSSQNSALVPTLPKAPSDSLTPRSGELQADGLVALWSLSLPQRPEHLLTTGSPVTTARFHPTEPKWVVGGCASGQLVVWDVRAGRLPVQKTKHHTHAIHGLRVLAGGGGFVSTSSDGKVNFWSLANLIDPAESIQIGDSISSFDVAAETGGTLVFGDDHGNLHAAVPSGQRRRQVRKLAPADGGHYGMVTSLSSKLLLGKAHNTSEGLSKGFLRGSAGLILSAGVDWTVKLWAPALQDTPLTSFVSHSYDSMSDVQWSPVNPSLFATCSSNGTASLWNLATSLEEPIESIAVDEEKGLNKLMWSLDGRRLAVASYDKLHILTFTEEMNARAEEEGKIMMNKFVAREWISNARS